jgi:hypothetical protein
MYKKVSSYLPENTLPLQCKYQDLKALKKDRIFIHDPTAPSGQGPPHYRGLTITLRYITLVSSPLDERSALLRDLYLTKHNTHKRQISMSQAGFETAVPAIKPPQTHALVRAGNGMGRL